MHWILTILILAGDKSSLNSQEYFARHNCQEAAAILKQQYDDIDRRMGYTVRFSCTSIDDSRLQ